MLENAPTVDTAAGQVLLRFRADQVLFVEVRMTPAEARATAAYLSEYAFRAEQEVSDG